MAKFRMIHTEFWDDPSVVEEFTPEDKLFYLYLLTNSKTTQIGIYQITKKQMAFDLGYSMETINALVDRFKNHHKNIEYNFETREIAIKNWGKYNFNKGGKPIEDCVKKELLSVKDKSLIEYVAKSVSNERIQSIYLDLLNEEKSYFEPSKIFDPSDQKEITTRDYVIWRDKQTCFYTGITLQLKDIQLDHIKPKGSGGGGSPYNLVVSCSKFNQLKSGDENLQEVIDQWNEKNPHRLINYSEIQKKINDLDNFEKLRNEHEITFRETIKNKIYDTYSIFDFLNTRRVQEEEKEEEKEEQEYKEQQQKDLSGRDGDFLEVIDFYRDNLQIGVSETLFNTELLIQFYEEWGKDLLVAAMKLAAQKEAKGTAFVEAVLKNWKEAGVKSLEDARRYQKKFKSQGQGYNRNGPKKDDITPDWYKKQKEEEKREKQHQKKSKEQREKEAADADKLLEEYLAQNA